MMNFFKRVAFLSLVAFITLTTISCGEEESIEPVVEPTPTPTTGVISINFRAYEPNNSTPYTPDAWKLTVKLLTNGGVFRTKEVTSKSTSFADIAPGNYTIKVSGYITLSTGIYEGDYNVDTEETQAVVVTAGNTELKDIDLIFYSDY